MIFESLPNSKKKIPKCWDDFNYLPFEHATNTDVVLVCDDSAGFKRSKIW